MLRTLLGLSLTVMACAAPAAANFDGQSWWSNVKILADDKFEVIRALTLDVANDPVRPAWKQDRFFRRYAAGGS